MIRCGGDFGNRRPPSRQLPSHSPPGADSPHRVFARDEPSSNRKLRPLPDNMRHRDPFGSPNRANSASMACFDRLDLVDSLESALDNRTAPAPPSTLPSGRVRVARGSYAGTFPCCCGPVEKLRGHAASGGAGCTAMASLPPSAGRQHVDSACSRRDPRQGRSGYVDRTMGFAKFRIAHWYEYTPVTAKRFGAVKHSHVIFRRFGTRS